MAKNGLQLHNNRFWRASLKKQNASQSTNSHLNPRETQNAAFLWPGWTFADFASTLCRMAFFPLVGWQCGVYYKAFFDLSLLYHLFIMKMVGFKSFIPFELIVGLAGWLV